MSNKGDCMNTPLQNKIEENLRHLNSFDLSKVLDFIEFLTFDKKKTIHNSEVIESICGKHKNHLSSSRDFAAEKQIEKVIEEAKWKER
jgi:hypothetical protein